MPLKSEAIEELSGVPLSELKAELEDVAGNLRLIVFGSYARGDFTSESDIDLLILVPDDLPAERENKLREVLREFAQKHNAFLAPIILKQSEFKRRLPLHLRLKEEGVEIE